MRPICPGGLRWTTVHPDWHPGAQWPQEVGSVLLEIPEATVIVDPLIAADESKAAAIWRVLDDRTSRNDRPVLVLVSAQWHRRSADSVCRRYDAQLWQPEAPVELPAGIEAEVVTGPVLSEQEALFLVPSEKLAVVADALFGDGAGGVRIPVDAFPPGERAWAGSTLKTWLASTLLGRDIERVVVSHGDPVLGDGEQALIRALA